MQRLCVSCGGVVCDGVSQCVVMVHVVWWCGLCGGVGCVVVLCGGGAVVLVCFVV